MNHHSLTPTANEPASAPHDCLKWSVVIMLLRKMTCTEPAPSPMIGKMNIALISILISNTPLNVTTC